MGNCLTVPRCAVPSLCKDKLPVISGETDVPVNDPGENPQDDNAMIDGMSEDKLKPNHSQPNDVELDSLNIRVHQDKNSVKDEVEIMMTDEAPEAQVHSTNEEFDLLRIDAAPEVESDVICSHPIDGELGLMGISIHYLANQFMAELEEAGLSQTSVMRQIEDLNSTNTECIIRRKSASIVCPIDHKIGAAYVHSISNKDDVGKANIMLSYTWEYTIGNVIDTLTGHCKAEGLDPKNTFVWICGLCLNQHRVVDGNRRRSITKFTDFQSEFVSRIKNIGHVLVMMAPWNAPEILTQAWCAVELFVANQHDCKLTFAMPPSHSEKFIDCIRGGNCVDQVKTLFQVLGSTDVRDTAAWSGKDRQHIMCFIECGLGYSKFNAKVYGLIKDWVLGVIDKEVLAIPHCLEDEMSKVKQGNLLNNIADLFCEIRDFDRLLTTAKEAYNINKSVHEQLSRNTAKSIELVGIGLLKTGEIEDAMKWMKDSLAIRENLLGPGHGETSDSIKWIAVILRLKGEKEEALKMHTKALGIREDVYGKQHAKTVDSLYAVAWMVKENGEIKEALMMFKEVLKIEKDLLPRKHIEMANGKFNIAGALYREGKKEKALETFEKAFSIFENVFGIDHPGTRQTRDWISRISAELGGNRRISFTNVS